MILNNRLFASLSAKNGPGSGSAVRWTCSHEACVCPTGKDGSMTLGYAEPNSRLLTVGVMLDIKTLPHSEVGESIFPKDAFTRRASATGRRPPK